MIEQHSLGSLLARSRLIAYCSRSASTNFLCLRCPLLMISEGPLLNNTFSGSSPQNTHVLHFVNILCGRSLIVGRDSSHTLQKYGSVERDIFLPYSFLSRASLQKISYTSFFNAAVGMLYLYVASYPDCVRKSSKENKNIFFLCVPIAVLWSTMR